MQIKTELWFSQGICPVVAQLVKNPHAVQGTWVQSLVQEDSLEKEMAAHSTTLA